jgi:hypothetical protein
MACRAAALHVMGCTDHLACPIMSCIGCIRQWMLLMGKLLLLFVVLTLRVHEPVPSCNIVLAVMLPPSLPFTTHSELVSTYKHGAVGSRNACCFGLHYRTWHGHPIGNDVTPLRVTGCRPSNVPTTECSTLNH